MASDTILTDDYVAGLLTKEAAEQSIKYSSIGLEAFKSTKPANKAKPNTRFLGRIIKETTNHNAALLAKETAEAQARLDDLTEAEEKKRRKLRPTPGDIRRRQLGDISSILMGGRRKRATEEDRARNGTSASEDKEKKSSEKDRHSRRDSKRHEDDDLKKSSRDRRHTREHREDDREHRKHRHRDRSRSPECSSSARKYRQRSPLSDEDEDGKHRRHRSSKSRTDRSRHGDDLLGDELPSRKRQGRLAEGDYEGHSKHKNKHGGSSRHEPSEESEDLDPLDDFIGPAPPSQSSSIVRPRGRGATWGRSLMDSRFSDSYDPKSEPAAEQPDRPDDWDEAVEVFRDRQKWKQQGAERLRTAGFTEEQIKKWEKQGPNGEKDLDDVRWSKKGERREWDRGKEVLEEGDI